MAGIGAIAALGLAWLSGPAAAAQALPNQVLALYPRTTGELVYVDVTALRRSPHYARIRAQVLPDRFRSLEQWTTALGIDFDREVRQLSWAFVSGDDKSGIGFVGIAEGQFPLGGVEGRARELKLGVSRSGGSTVVSLGKNEQGGEFVFAFMDASTLVFGSRAGVEEIVTRRTQGGQSVLDNPALRDQILQLNGGRSPVWFALDSRFSGLALKQMLPEASQVQGFDAVASRIQSTTLRLDIRTGLTSQAVVRCQDAADCVVLSSAAQAGFALQAVRLKESTPELARALGEARIQRTGTGVEMEFTLPEPQFASLLARNGLALKF